MVRTGAHIWARHPHVDNDLTLGERAADVLKKWFGTWSILGLMAAIILFWLLLMHDPGELMLNLGLSCMASVQGIILQIAANRGDKKAAELAIATNRNSELLVKVNNQQLLILEELRRRGGDQ